MTSCKELYRVIIQDVTDRKRTLGNTTGSDVGLKPGWHLCFGFGPIYLLETQEPDIKKTQAFPNDAHG